MYVCLWIVPYLAIIACKMYENRTGNGVDILCININGNENAAKKADNPTPKNSIAKPNKNPMIVNNIFQLKILKIILL